MTKKELEHSCLLHRYPDPGRRKPITVLFVCCLFVFWVNFLVQIQLPHLADEVTQGDHDLLLLCNWNGTKKKVFCFITFLL